MLFFVITNFVFYHLTEKDMFRYLQKKQNTLFTSRFAQQNKNSERVC